MTAEEIIKRLGLQQHPKEDGYFIETHRSMDRISWEALPGGYNGDRAYSTAIYFLLTEGGYSELHRLRSDEVYHYYMGAPLELLLLLPDGSGKMLRLGTRLNAGELPQIVVPRNAWQGAMTTGAYTLFGCTVAPGFEYPDYETGNREDLVRKYPEFEEEIRRLTR